MKIRVLPIVIFAIVLFLGVKIGNIWTELGISGVSETRAQQARQENTRAIPAKTDPNPAAKPGAKTDKKTADPVRAASIAAGGTGLPSDPTLFTQAEIDLLQKLADRRGELEKWARDLVMREQLLKATEKRIFKKVGELGAIQGKIKGMLKQYDKEQENKLKSLVKIYESMKPKDAARIFMELEMSVLLDVVERMREARAAKIIAKMAPGKAKRVTMELAQRRKFGMEMARRLPASLPKATP